MAMSYEPAEDNEHLLGEIAKRDELIAKISAIHVRRDDDPYILGPTCRRCHQSWPCATAAALGKRD